MLINNYENLSLVYPHYMNKDDDHMDHHSIKIKRERRIQQITCLYIQSAYKIPGRPNIFRKRSICDNNVSNKSYRVLK